MDDLMESSGVPLLAIAPDEPERTPRIGAYGLREAGHCVANARARAVANEREIEDAPARPFGADERDAISRSGADAVDRDAAEEARSALEQRPEQRLEKDPSVETDAEEPRPRAS